MSQVSDMQQWLIQAVLVVIFGFATRSDIRSRRIPNQLVVSGLVIAWVIHLFSGLQFGPVHFDNAWKTPAFGTLAGLAVFMPLYLLRACGAGDVKLMAMVGAFVGPVTVLHAALCTLIAGGVLSLVFMLFKGVATQTLNNVRFIVTDLMVRVRSGGSPRIEPLATTAARLPYAVAISAGTLAALLLHPDTP
jgi:prepilin peptidase CpaA